MAVVAPAAVCFCACAWIALRLPVFFGADEAPHFRYTASIIDGRLPEFTTDRGANERYPIIREAMPDPPPPGRPVPVWEAYHPPLAYVLAAPAVWAAGDLVGDRAAALAMRLVNAAGMATGVAFAGLFAGEVFPGRRGLGFAAACLTAVLPGIVGTGALGHNDGVAFALSSAGLWLAARLLRRGPSPGRIVAACLVAGAGMLTRVSLAPIAALLAVAATLAVLRHRPAGPAAGTLAGTRVRAAGAGLAVAASTVALAGWFYARNRALYGSLTSPKLSNRLHHHDPGGLPAVLLARRFHSQLWTGLVASLHTRLTAPHPLTVALALGGLIIAGLTLAAVRLWRAPGRPSSAGIGATGWLAVAGCCGAVVLSAAWHVSLGGGAHPRYLFPLVPVATALLARAIAELPAPRLVLLAVVTGLGALVVSQAARYQSVIEDPTHAHPFDLPSSGPVARAAPLVLGLAAVAACVVVGARLGRLGGLVGDVDDVGDAGDATAPPGPEPAGALPAQARVGSNP